MKLTPEQITAITDAVQRELMVEDWDESKDKTLADLCAVNQDALIDDLYENDPRDAEHRHGMITQVATYDALLSTNRAGELPPEWSAPKAAPKGCDYQPVEGDPSIRVCATHDSELGLFGDEACPQDKSHG